MAEGFATKITFALEGMQKSAEQTTGLLRGMKKMLGLVGIGTAFYLALEPILKPVFMMLRAVLLMLFMPLIPLIKPFMSYMQNLMAKILEAQKAAESGGAGPLGQFLAGLKILAFDPAIMAMAGLLIGAAVVEKMISAAVGAAVGGMVAKTFLGTAAAGAAAVGTTTGVATGTAALGILGTGVVITGGILATAFMAALIPSMVEKATGWGAAMGGELVNKLNDEGFVLGPNGLEPGKPFKEETDYQKWGYAGGGGSVIVNQNRGGNEPKEPSWLQKFWKGGLWGKGGVLDSQYYEDLRNKVEDVGIQYNFATERFAAFNSTSQTFLPQLIEGTSGDKGSLGFAIGGETKGSYPIVYSLNQASLKWGTMAKDSQIAISSIIAKLNEIPREIVTRHVIKTVYESSGSRFA